jgi:hypothetical protein
MRYSEFSKKMSSLYLRLAAFCLFEARFPEIDTPPPLPVQYTVYTEHYFKFRDSSFKLAEYI